MTRGFNLMAIGLLVGMSLPAGLAPAAGRESSGDADPANPLQRAVIKQQEVVASLARILEQNQVMLSDGAIQLALESLLADERKQADAIRELGKRTLGRSEQELGEEDRATRDRLADDQAVYAARWARLARGMETKAGSRPDSVFVEALMIAADDDLAAQIESASGFIDGNQLGNALRATNAAIACLEKMIKVIARQSDGDGDEKAPGEVAFTPPSLQLQGLNEALPQFGWSGDQIDPLGHILRAVKRLEQLAERQRNVADTTRERAAHDQTAPGLAEEELEIRYLALEVGASLALMTPSVERMVRAAGESIENAVGPMQKGPLSDALAPAEQAADELEAAATSLRTLWKDIIARIKKYAMETGPVSTSAQGIPHGASQEKIEAVRRLVMILLRVTGALTQAIERENELLEQTAQASSQDQWQAIRQEQDRLPPFLRGDVMSISSALDPDAAPARLESLVTGAAPAIALLTDAVDRMQRASTAMAGQDRPEALKRQRESVELMNDALDVLIPLLQKLLGQMAPQALTSESSATSGMAIDPSGQASLSEGFFFGLPSEVREQIRQAFRGNFPRRYDDAIKRYYEAIAAE